MWIKPFLFLLIMINFIGVQAGNIRAGNFENHKYDGTPTKNDWHYVIIERIGQNYKWSNKAGVSWTLYLTDDPNSLRVGEDSPYYADHGHRTALFTDNGVYGPFDEFYDLEEHCPIGWTSLSTGCYMFNRASDGQTYQEAKNFCRGKGGYLVKIDDQEEQDALWQFCQDNQLDKRVAWWLGATDSDEEGEWKWDYTGEIFFLNGQSLRYNAFYPGGGGLPAEPNNNKNEDCLAADSDSRAFKWNDLQCTWKTWTWRKLKALCEYPVSKGLFSDPVDACLQYLNNEIITGITLEECKEKCSSATSFICHSLDYERSVSRCLLSEDSKKTQPSAYKEPCYDGTDSTYLEQIFTE